MRTPVVVLAVLSLAAQAAVVGVSVPAESLTEARVRTLPAAEQAPWLEYLERSRKQRTADKTALAAEREGMRDIPAPAREGFSGRAIPLDKDAVWYGGEEARKKADILLSFQTPAGGWSKNLAFDTPRAKGQSFTTNNLSRYLGKDDFDEPSDRNWNYVGTLDNDATNTELMYLARVAQALPGHEGDAYRRSVLRGLEYLLAAQYPNGGWPQVWPLEGGYHDTVTFNDNAVTESAETLTAAAEEWTFVPASMKARARAAVARADDCILRAQVRMPLTDGKGSVLTVWPQQADPLTLAPVAGRNFEPAALSSGESADIVLYLMKTHVPSKQMTAAVEAAVAWFQANEVHGYRWSGGRGTEGGRRLTADEKAPAIWPRFVSIRTGKAVFGDRDKTIHDDVMELSLERRNGYAWYGEGPQKVLDAYPAWRAKRGRR